MSAPERSAASLTAELNQLREALENAHRRLQVLQKRAAGAPARSVEFMDRIGPALRYAAVPPQQAAVPLRPAWPTGLPDARPLQPTPGLANLTLAGQGLPAVGFSVCGLGRGEIERILELVANKLGADRNFVPVFLTDVMAADLFRRHRFAFEYFPPPEAMARLRGTRPLEDYARQRLALVKRKYTLTQVIVFGRKRFAEVTD